MTDLPFLEELALEEARFKRFKASGTGRVKVAGGLRTGLAINIDPQEEEEEVTPTESCPCRVTVTFDAFSSFCCLPPILCGNSDAVRASFGVDFERECDLNVDALEERTGGCTWFRNFEFRSVATDECCNADCETECAGQFLLDGDGTPRTGWGVDVTRIGDTWYVAAGRPPFIGQVPNRPWLMFYGSTTDISIPVVNTVTCNIDFVIDDDYSDWWAGGPLHYIGMSGEDNEATISNVETDDCGGCCIPEDDDFFYLPYNRPNCIPTTETRCTEIEGEWASGLQTCAGTTCDDYGACCDVFGDCIYEPEEDCSDTYLGDGTYCKPTPPGYGIDPCEEE